MWFGSLALLAVITASRSTWAMPAGGTGQQPPTQAPPAPAQGQVQGQPQVSGMPQAQGQPQALGHGPQQQQGGEVGGAGGAGGAGAGGGGAVGGGFQGQSQLQPAGGIPGAAPGQQPNAQMMTVKFPTQEVTWLHGTLKINPALAQQQIPGYFHGDIFNTMANLPLDKINMEPSQMIAALTGIGGKTKRAAASNFSPRSDNNNNNLKVVSTPVQSQTWIDTSSMQISETQAAHDLPDLLDHDKIKKLLHFDKRDLVKLDKRGLWATIVDAGKTIWSIINPFHCKRCKVCLVFAIFTVFEIFPFTSTLCSVVCTYAWSFWTDKCSTWVLNPAGVKYGKNARKKLSNRAISGREIVTIGSGNDEAPEEHETPEEP